jgi:HSP20 family protein
MLSPFRGRRGFYDPVSEMNRMFDDMLGGMMRRPGGQQQRSELTEWAPAIDVVAKDGNLVLRAELPGIKQEERRYGSFSRSLTLPQGVDESKIHARYEDGVLEVTVEGAAAVQEPKRIQIEGS